MAQIRRRLLHPSNELLGATADALADAYAAGGSFAGAAEQCATSLAVMSHAYAADSTAVAHCKLKLARLLASEGSGGSGHGGERVRQLRAEVAAVLALHHGAAAAADLLAG